jgi:hypothetical protein
MRPRERRPTGQTDMFRARLDQIIDLNHRKRCSDPHLSAAELMEEAGAFAVARGLVW